MVAQGESEGAGVSSGTVVSVQICSFCWFQANPGRKPARVARSPHVPCFDCGTRTNSGLFVRRHEKQERPVDWIE